jgi:muramoyltetrapeptide carboxypeptidase
MLPTIKPHCGVAVVAPAGPVSDSAYRAGIALLSARYEVVHAYDPTAQRSPSAAAYLAADDETRAAWLNQALADPAVHAVFCARGGYGSTRILDRLDRKLFAERRVPLIGFSDVTALHGWAACMGTPTIHGPVVTQLPRLPSEQLDALYALLETGATTTLRKLKKVHGGVAEGPLFAGNLTVLTHLIGTPYMPQLEGHIVLLEDVGEAPYRIDRMCTQLLQSGVLEGIAGIVLGQFIACGGEREPESPDASKADIAEVHDGPSASLAEAVLEERLGRLGVPIVSNAPVGHATDNVALPLGQRAVLDAERGILSPHRSQAPATGQDS